MIKEPKKENTRQIKPNESELRHIENSTDWLASEGRKRINSFAKIFQRKIKDRLKAGLQMILGQRILNCLYTKSFICKVINLLNIQMS